MYLSTSYKLLYCFLFAMIALFFYKTTSLSSEAMIFPLLILTIMAILTVASLFKNIKNKSLLANQLQENDADVTVQSDEITMLGIHRSIMFIFWLLAILIGGYLFSFLYAIPVWMFCYLLYYKQKLAISMLYTAIFWIVLYEGFYKRLYVSLDQGLWLNFIY